jgi:hypothetical protein
MQHMLSMLVTVSLSIALHAGHWQPRVRFWTCQPGGLCERADHSAHQVSGVIDRGLSCIAPCVADFVARK